MAKAPVVFGLDIGIGSLGECVRVGNDFIHVESLLIDQEFAGTQAQAVKRRMFRTRQAHKARELWLNRQCEAAGIPVLKQIEKTGSEFFKVKSVDKRLNQEFPSKGDETIYTSCLLRIALLEGKKLEPWQIYKALHSAIQKRGYDQDVAWKTRSEASTEMARESSAKAKKEEEEENEKLSAFLEQLQKMSSDQRHHLPCYFEAYQMGVWSPNEGVVKIRQDNHAKPASLNGKGYTASREMVLKELRGLLVAAKKHFPKLDVEEAIFGPAKVPYASFKAENRKKFKLKRGHSTDWNGLLGQKIPRFDNRILSQCLLIPRLHTCRADDVRQKRFHLLSALHRLRFTDSKGEIRGFTPDEFKKAASKVLPNTQDIDVHYHLTKTQLKKLLKEICNGEPNSAQPLIEKPRSGGRSRFSRPTLWLLEEFYLSGLSPVEFKKHALTLKWPLEKGRVISSNSDPIQGLTPQDLGFLERLSDRTWSNFSVVGEEIEVPESEAEREAAIRKLIGEVNNPKVRHRLEHLRRRLEIMSEKTASHLGGLVEPDAIAVEFVREDFMGPKKKSEYLKAMADLRKANEEASERAKELKIGSKDASLRYKLAKEQGFTDPYDGSKLAQTKLDSYEIDHIVPRALGGPDAFYNKVLTKRDNNGEKGERTPHAWLSPLSARWGQYLAIIEGMKVLSRKKRELLLSPDALEKCEKYTALAETAYIAKLAQNLIYLHFGWKRPEQGGAKRVIAVNGGLTARVRSKYRLNSLLGETGSNVEKDRKDKRHHALDAMVISFLQGWMRDPKKEKFFKFPEGVSGELFERHLSQTPARTVAGKASELEENFYGLRGGKFVVKAVPLYSLGVKTEKGKEVFDLTGLKDSAYDVYPELDEEILNQSFTDEKVIKTFERTNPVHAFLVKAVKKLEDLDPQEALETWVKLCAKAKTPDGTMIRRARLIDSDEGDLLLDPDYAGELKLVLQDEIHPRVILKPKGTHLSQLVYRDRSNSIKVRPIYVHENPKVVRSSLRDSGFDILVEISSGDIVRLNKGLGERLPPGRYKVKSLYTNGQLLLLNIDGSPVKYSPRIAMVLEQGGLRKE